MRDELIAGIIFAAMCAVFVLNGYAVNDCTKSVYEQVESFKTAIDSGNAGQIERSTELLAKSWEKKMKNISYSCQHSQIDAIEDQIFSAVHYAERKQYEKARYKACKAQYLLSDLSKSEKLRLDNIF